MDISQRCPLTSSWRRKMEGHLSSVEAIVWGQECTQDIGQATTWQIGSFCGSPSAEISYSKFSAFKWSVLISVDFIVSGWLFRKHQWGVVLEMDASRVLLSLRQEPQRERKHSSGAVQLGNKLFEPTACPLKILFLSNLTPLSSILMRQPPGLCSFSSL